MHLLPTPVYKALLKTFGETPDELIHIKKSGISIERFEKIAKRSRYTILSKDYYFINPIYKYKFNMKVRKQSKIIGSIPYLRDFLTTGVFYLIQK